MIRKVDVKSKENANTRSKENANVKSNHKYIGEVDKHGKVYLELLLNSRSFKGAF